MLLVGGSKRRTSRPITYCALHLAVLEHVVPLAACLLLLLLLVLMLLALVSLAPTYHLRAERQLKEDAERDRVDAEAEEIAVEEALRNTRQQLATVSRELLDH